MIFLVLKLEQIYSHVHFVGMPIVMFAPNILFVVLLLLIMIQLLCAMLLVHVLGFIVLRLYTMHVALHFFKFRFVFVV